MSNIKNIGAEPLPAGAVKTSSTPSLDGDPAELEALRERLRRESQARFEELANAPFLPRED
jgi:hypothetical protein